MIIQCPNRRLKLFYLIPCLEGHLSAEVIQNLNPLKTGAIHLNISVISIAEIIQHAKGQH